MADIFGFEIRRKRTAPPLSVVTPLSDDGATVVGNAAAHYGLVLDLEGAVKNENELIKKYRQTSQYADCDSAIEEIVNEAIIVEPNKAIVSIDLDRLNVSPAIKDRIRFEFENVYQLLKFERSGHDLFRQWYIDGRLYFNIVIDDAAPDRGIVELQLIDPRKIRKVKDIVKRKNEQGVEVIVSVNEYYIYNDKGISENTTQGIKLSLDSIIYVPSGLIDSNGNNMVIGHLHKAIKPANQLKMMEDALVIYRLSRAPERRIFYIDVGNLPKQRAEQYVADMMVKFRNKIVYDTSTGEIKDNRQHLSIMEDFWMPRREGGKSTEITTLQGGQNLNQIEDVQYFQTKLFQALNVPISRLNPSDNFTLGRTNEITRDEIKFSRFVDRLRNKFNALFRGALRIQLITKQIIKPEEWDIIDQFINFDYQQDNHFSELKQAELFNTRIQTVNAMDPYIGRYFSTMWIRKNILQQTEQDIVNMEQEMQVDRQMMLQAQVEQEKAMQQATAQPKDQKK